MSYGRTWSKVISQNQQDFYNDPKIGNINPMRTNMANNINNISNNMNNNMNTNLNNNFNGYNSAQANMNPNRNQPINNVNNVNIVKNEESSNIVHNANNIKDMNNNVVTNAENKDESVVNTVEPTLNAISNFENENGNNNINGNNNNVNSNVSNNENTSADPNDNVNGSINDDLNNNAHNDDNDDNNVNNNNNKSNINNNNNVEQRRRSPTNQQTSNALLMFHASKYEIKCDETFAYYEGYVIDYDEKEKKLHVLYDNDWKPEQKVPLDYVRKVAPTIDRSKWKPKTSDKVECKAKAEESEPYGWWGCKISTVRDNLFLITYEGWENHHEVLQPNMLRPYNNNKPFNPNTNIVRRLRDIEPPYDHYRPNAMQPNNKNKTNYLKQVDEMREWILKPSTHEKLQNIKEKTGLIHLGYRPDLKKILFIGTSKQVVFAYKLISYLWELKKKYGEKEKRAKKEEIKLKNEFSMLKSCYKIEFSFDEKLTRYVIGKSGENYKKARDIDGVQHVRIGNGHCLILADDENSANDARELLDIVMDTIDVPSTCVKEIIGKNGVNVQKLENLTHVSSLSTMLRWRKYLDDEEKLDPRYQKCDENSGNSRMIIIGPKGNIDGAKAAIQQQIDFIESRTQYNNQIDSVNAKLNNNYNSSGMSQRRRSRMNNNNNNTDNDVNKYNYTKNKANINNNNNNNNGNIDKQKQLSNDLNVNNNIDNDINIEDNGNGNGNDINETINDDDNNGGNVAWDSYVGDDLNDDGNALNDPDWDNNNVNNENDEWNNDNDNYEINNQYNNGNNNNDNSNINNNVNDYGYNNNYNRRDNRGGYSNRGYRGRGNRRGNVYKGNRARTYEKLKYIRKTKPNNNTDNSNNINDSQTK